MIIEHWCKKRSQEGVVGLLPNTSINAGVIQDGEKMVLTADNNCVPAIRPHNLAIFAINYLNCISSRSCFNDSNT